MLLEFLIRLIIDIKPIINNISFSIIKVILIQLISVYLFIKIFNKRYILNDNNLKIGKSLASTDYWNTSSTDYAVGNDLTQNNKTGFNAKPTGYVPASTGWGAALAFETTCFMNTYKSSSNVLSVSGISSNSASFGGATMGGNPGLAVRCVSNLTPLQFRDWYIKQYGSLQHHLPQELGVPTITFRHW